jgi:Uma2 family endonuclease
MNLVTPRPWNLPLFLDWEARQETRHEFDGTSPVAMTGGTAGHETIGATLRALLREALRGKPCRVWGPTMKIDVAGRIRYPDAFVSCTPIPREAAVVTDPVVVFEIISPQTARIDRITKLREYQQTPCIQRYVILEQEGIEATVLHRKDGDWLARALTSDDTLSMPEIGIELPLATCYADLDLPAG